MHLPICLSAHLHTHLPVQRFISTPAHTPGKLCTCPHMHMPESTPMCLPTYEPSHLSVCKPAYTCAISLLSIHVPIHLSTCTAPHCTTLCTCLPTPAQMPACVPTCTLTHASVCLNICPTFTPTYLHTCAPAHLYTFANTLWGPFTWIGSYDLQVSCLQGVALWSQLCHLLLLQCTGRLSVYGLP